MSIVSLQHNIGPNCCRITDLTNEKIVDFIFFWSVFCCLGYSWMHWMLCWMICLFCVLHFDSQAPGLIWCWSEMIFEMACLHESSLEGGVLNEKRNFGEYEPSSGSGVLLLDVIESATEFAGDESLLLVRVRLVGGKTGELVASLSSRMEDIDWSSCRCSDINCS